MICSNDNVYQDSISFFVSSLVFKQLQQNRYFIDLSFLQTKFVQDNFRWHNGLWCVCVHWVDIQKRIELDVSEMITPLVLNMYMYIVLSLTLLNTFRSTKSWLLLISV